MVRLDQQLIWLKACSALGGTTKLALDPCKDFMKNYEDIGASGGTSSGTKSIIIHSKIVVIRPTATEVYTLLTHCRTLQSPLMQHPEMPVHARPRSSFIDNPSDGSEKSLSSLVLYVLEHLPPHWNPSHHSLQLYRPLAALASYWWNCH